MSESVGCGRPTGKLLGSSQPQGGSRSQARTEAQDASSQHDPQEDQMNIMVGRKAPDFEAPAYHRGEFKTVKLSDSLGHWSMVCFYPGDFTFV